MDIIEKIKKFLPIKESAMLRLIDAVKSESRFKIVHTEKYGQDFICEIIISHRGKLWRIGVEPNIDKYEYRLKRPGEKLSAWTINRWSPNGYELMLEHILEN
jgi:hypothetical protein